MAYNEINKTHRCAGRIRASIRLKCKDKFTIKKKAFFFFNQSWSFPQKFFGADSIPYMAIKLSIKVHSQSAPGTTSRENQHASHFGQYQRPLTLQSTQPSPWHFHHKTKTALSLPTHVTPPCRKQKKKKSHQIKTYTLSSLDPYLVKEKSLCLF